MWDESKEMWDEDEEAEPESCIEDLESELNDHELKIDELKSKIDDSESTAGRLESRLGALESEVKDPWFGFNLPTSIYRLGAMIAISISWSCNHSILWATVHGITSWGYVIFYASRRAEWI
jgi:hypothetical protein